MSKRAVFERSRRELSLGVSVGVHILLVVEQSSLESQSLGCAQDSDTYGICLHFLCSLLRKTFSLPYAYYMRLCGICFLSFCFSLCFFSVSLPGGDVLDRLLFFLVRSLLSAFPAFISPTVFPV